MAVQKLIKTKAIVLSYLRYRESSLIVRVFTEEKGACSLLVNNVRTAGKRKHSGIALYQPFSLLEVVMYFSPDSDLHRLSEAKVLWPLQQIPFDIHKTTVALFLSEVLGRCLRTDEEQQELFRFLTESILAFDSPHTQTNFHVQFLLKLSIFLGFAPQTAREMAEQLQQAGYFWDTVPVENIFESVIENDYGQCPNLLAGQRLQLLEATLKFYALHVENFGEIRSFTVLKEIYA
jgi:DNA repair protein RecO (recombination protein O)